MSDVLGLAAAVALVVMLWGAAFWVTRRSRAWSAPDPRRGPGR